MKNSNKNRAVLLSLLIIIIAQFNVVPQTNSILNVVEVNGYPESIQTSSWSPEYIHINDNWTAAKAAYTYVQGGDGTEDDPYIIENIIMDASTSPTDSGIYIQDSKDYFIIRNCEVSNAGTGATDGGIRLNGVENGQILNNNCSDNGRTGILLRNSCEDNIISNNIANDNDYYGIYLYDSCSNNTISENNAMNKNTPNTQNTGIFIEGSTFNLVKENTVVNNNDQGFALFNSAHNNTVVENTAYDDNPSPYQNSGIIIDTAHGNNISKNIFRDNNNYGIRLDASDYCIISENVLYDNGQQGLYAISADSNVISGNIIFDNDDGIVCSGTADGNYFYYNSITNNPSDNGVDNSVNHWNNTVFGNYWGDYSGTDNNGDGIGDTAYAISSQFDYLPLMNIFPSLIIIPDDIIFELGSEGNYLNWTVADASPFIQNYVILKDGVSVKSETVLTRLTEISLEIDGLSAGTYIYTLQVTDSAGKESTDVVYVTVNASTETESDGDPEPQPDLFSMIMSFLDQYSTILIPLIIGVFILLGAKIIGNSIKKRPVESKPEITKVAPKPKQIKKGKSEPKKETSRK